MRYIFTVVVGRSGQFSLANTINKYGKDCFAEAEPPNLLLNNKFTPSWIKNFQRKYIVTNEMLGRGKALKWFEEGLDEKIQHQVEKKIDRIKQIRLKKDFSFYFEISKFFSRTQCEAFYKLIPSLELIKLTRNPIANAKSFLNRNKNFYLDNNSPESKINCLIMDSKSLSKFELYLWSWFETELRFKRFVDKHNINSVFEIKTEELNSRKKIIKLFEYFEVNYDFPEQLDILNTNFEHGLPKTLISKDDISQYQSFLDKVPNQLIEKIDYLKNFNELKLLD